MVFVRLALACAALGAAALLPRPARAEPPATTRAVAQTDAVEPAGPSPLLHRRPPVVREAHADVSPNRGLTTAGLLVFGVPYALSVLTAANSYYVEDAWLYVPVVGPWAALAARGPCDGPYLGSHCANATQDGVVLVLDGVLQASGAAMLIASVVVPERHLMAADNKTIHVAPSVGRSNVGVAAYGRF